VVQAPNTKQTISARTWAQLHPSRLQQLNRTTPPAKRLLNKLDKTVDFGNFTNCSPRGKARIVFGISIVVQR
jgi:hypothetical protein